MVVRKIIESTLEEGQTSITITDTDIPGSLVRTYSNDPDLMPTQVVLTGSTLKIDYEAQTSDKYVAVELVKQGLDIIDNLESTDTDAALSAKQGKVLKDLVDGITPITELTELDDVSADDPQTGDILKYSGTSEKWEKYNLPDIPSYLEQLGDVVINSVVSGQVLTYNGAYWTNATPSSGGGSDYSGTEEVIGTWFNKPLYRKTITVPGFSSSLALSGNVYHGNITISDYLSNVDKIFGIADKSFIEVATNSYRGFLSILSEDDTVLDCYTAYSRSGTATITVEYTKTTD